MKNGNSKHTKRAEICKNYEVYHFDEFPILFSGLNRRGETVAGSFICENEEEKLLEFFHAIVKEEDFNAFADQAISYLELLKKAQAIFYVKRNYSNQMMNARLLAFAEIPYEQLPLPGAIFPKSSIVAG